MDNLNQLWDRAVADYPEEIGLVYKCMTYPYARLDQLVGRFAATLRDEFGFERGDRLALIMPNGPYSMACYFGALRAGAVVVPVNTRLKADEMHHILADSEAKAAVVHRNTWPAFWQAAADLESLEAAIGVDVHQKTITPIQECLVGEELHEAPDADPDDVAAIIYTSGTTGMPKGAQITHGNVLFNVNATIEEHGFQGDDIHIVVVPLFHVTGLNTIMPTAFAQGATLIVSRRTEPSRILELIEQREATTFFGVPTTMVMVANMPDIDEYDLSTLRLVAYSGAPMPPTAIRTLPEKLEDVELHNFYGLTETTSVTAVLPDEQALERPASVGRVVDGLGARIIDDNGNELPAGKTGELVVRGPSVFKGYLNQPKATEEAFIDDWFKTGDYAYMDEEGYIFLQGRKDHTIIVGGENVYPVQVENVLTAHPDVLEAAAVGQPHDVFGEVVRAIVVAEEDREVDAAELKQFCSTRLASFKVPKFIEFRRELPRNPSGKVIRDDLQED